MKEEITVYVVMGNDFPDAVFSSEAAADAFCKAEKPKDPRIYWRAYAFVIDKEVTAS